MGKYRLEIVLMDDNTEAIYAESGMKGLKKADRKGYASYEVKTYDFDTKAERDAYLKGIEDMSYCSWSQAAVIENVHLRTIDEIRKELVGRQFRHYNSFNGSHQFFTVATVKKKGNCYILLDEDQNRKIYVESDVLDIVLDDIDGYYKKTDVIDGCSVFEEWKLQ